MAVICKDLLELSTLSDMRIAAGSAGIDRRVTWAYIGENINVDEWGKGGEVLFITGIGMDRSDEGIIKLIKKCYKYDLAALVISVNDMYIDHISDKVATVADKYRFPIFTIPWSVKRIDVLKEISFLVMQEQQDEGKKGELLRLLKASGNDDSDRKTIKHIVNTIGIEQNDKFAACVIEAVFGSKANNKNVLERISRDIEENLFRYKVINIIDSRKIYCLIYGEDICDNKQYLYEQLQKIIDEKIEQSKVEKIYAGFCIEENIENSSIQNAKTAMKIAKKISMKSRILIYDDLGIYRIIYKDTRQGERMMYCQNVLEKVIEYDNSSGESYLVDTINAYFENMFNISKTANHLYIHRNSLMYRLNKIEQLTGRNLKDPYELMDLVYCAIAYKFFNLK